MAPQASAYADQVGQIRTGEHGGLIHHDERARADGQRAAAAAAAGQVTQELSGVIRHRHTGGRQGIAGRLGRGDADHRAEPGGGPSAGGFGQHPRLTRPGGSIDHRHPAAVRERRQGRGGLVLAQPAVRSLASRVIRALAARVMRARVLRVERALVLRGGGAAGQRILQPRRVRAKCVRGLRAVQARRAVRAGLREHALFHDQLRARGVPDAAVPLVDATPVCSQQAARNVHQFRRLQAEDRLELRPQRLIGQVLQ